MTKIFIFILGYIFSFNCLAVDFAITIDDPNLNGTPKLSPVKRDEHILRRLNSAGKKAALFVCGMRIDSSLGTQLLRRWDSANHIIGNHTYSHINYSNPMTSFEVFSSDISRVEPHIDKLRNYQKIFRFPFLKSGDSVVKRDLIRNFLTNNDYRFGYVTIDASDWYISSRLERRLRQNPNSDLSGYRDYYLKHMWERSQYYDALANRVLGRSPRHTVLIHHNLLNALFLGDLIAHYESKGWRLIDADIAFQDSIFALTPDTIPSGESIIWALAKQAGIDGLRYPAEDGRYQQAEMNRLGL